MSCTRLVRAQFHRVPQLTRCTWTIVLLDHKNASTKTECVKMPYQVLYDYSYSIKKCFWENKQKPESDIGLKATLSKKPCKSLLKSWFPSHRGRDAQGLPQRPSAKTIENVGKLMVCSQHRGNVKEALGWKRYWTKPLVNPCKIDDFQPPREVLSRGIPCQKVNSNTIQWNEIKQNKIKMKAHRSVF